MLKPDTKKRFLIFVCAAAAALGFCAGLHGAEVPMPSGHVNDFAGVISAEYRQKISDLITELESKTSAEIAVVTVQSIAPYDEKAYARLIFDNWKIGKKAKDNGVLILLAVKERRWRIEVGYGLEGALPDGLCGEIGREQMAPYLRQGQYGKGLYYGAAAAAKIISEDAKVSIDGLKGLRLGGQQADASIFLYIFIPVFFFLWNMPWPIYIGLPFTLIFALVFFQISPVLGFLTIGAYIASQMFRFNRWSRMSPHKRRNFFGTQNYGGTFTTGGFGGGFGGSGGGFGGGGGGGGGAGGGF